MMKSRTIKIAADSTFRFLQVFNGILELTDKELLKMLSKDEVILENEFNKVLLDLEIKGLISVSWLTKDTKRIEYITIETEDDDYEKQIQESEEKDYEASFPNSD